MLFVDSCDPLAVQEIFSMGIAYGVTTNPLILARRTAELGSASTLEVLQHLLSVAQHPPFKPPVFVQLTSPAESAMVNEAQVYRRELGPQIGIKVPFSEVGLRVAKRLLTERINVNITSVMSVSQAYLALMTRCQHVSLFMGRISDMGQDPLEVIAGVRELMNAERERATLFKANIIVGSIRQPRDVMDALRAGAHIVTASPDILKKLLQNPGTEAVNAEFQAAVKAT